MKKFDCPHCHHASFSWWDKYLAAKWKILKCSHCGSRVCSAPMILAAFYLLYLADVINFSYLSLLLESNTWVVVAVIGWLILDLFSVYLPLRAMRSYPAGDRPDDKEAAGSAQGKMA